MSRYATETHFTEEAIVKAFDGVRRAQLVQKRRGHVSFFNSITSVIIFSLFLDSIQKGLEKIQ